MSGNDDDMPKLSDDETLALQIVLGVILFCQVCLMLAAIFNTCFYLIPLRIKNTLILLFYIGAYLVTGCYGVSAYCYIRHPENMFYDFDEHLRFIPSVITGCIADCGMCILGYIILAKTIRIILSIHVLYEGLEKGTATCIQYVINIFMSICVTVHVSALVLFYVDQQYTAEYVAFLEAGVTVLLLILFSATLCWFLHSLQRYKIRHELSKEKRVVRIYFYAFFIGLAVKAIYSFYWFLVT